MDSGEIVYASVEEVIGKTGKSHHHPSIADYPNYRIKFTYLISFVFVVGSRGGITQVKVQF